MPTLSEKKEIILDHETRFAQMLAREVIERPPPSLWMILIPVFFVFFFMRVQKAVKGRREFSEHYLVSRRRALDAALAAVEENRGPDIEALCRASTSPPEALKQYRAWIGVLVDHYIDLIRSEGADYRSLVRAAYKSKTDYLLAVNRLNQAEKGYNKALRPHLDVDEGQLGDTIERIENASAALRRQAADDFF